MKYPRVYKAPKVENLASKADVAWGECSPAGGVPSATVCGYNGLSAGGECVDVGFVAGGACTGGGTPV